MSFKSSTVCSFTIPEIGRAWSAFYRDEYVEKLTEKVISSSPVSLQCTEENTQELASRIIRDIKAQIERHFILTCEGHSGDENERVQTVFEKSLKKKVKWDWPLFYKDHVHSWIHCFPSRKAPAIVLELIQFAASEKKYSLWAYLLKTAIEKYQADTTLLSNLFHFLEADHRSCAEKIFHYKDFFWKQPYLYDEFVTALKSFASNNGWNSKKIVAFLNPFTPKIKCTVFLRLLPQMDTNALSYFETYFDLSKKFVSNSALLPYYQTKIQLINNSKNPTLDQYQKIFVSSRSASLTPLQKDFLSLEIAKSLFLRGLPYQGYLECVMSSKEGEVSQISCYAAFMLLHIMEIKGDYSDFNKAYNPISITLELDQKQSWHIHKFMSDFYLRNGNVDKAEFILKKAILKFPKTGVFYQRLAQLYLFKGEISMAKQAIDEGLLSSPSCGELLCEKARLFMNPHWNGNPTSPEEVEKVLHEAIRLTPQFGDSYLELMRFYSGSKTVWIARKKMKEVQGLVEQNDPTYGQLWQYLKNDRITRYEEVFTAFEKLPYQSNTPYLAQLAFNPAHDRTSIEYKKAVFSTGFFNEFKKING